MKTVEPYGSARISETGDKDLSPILIKYAATGAAAVPLGHNDTNPLLGAMYSMSSAGAHKGHALTFGRTRGGKGVSAIIPALLTYSGSMVVIDPKGENAWITAARRRSMGQRVVILDPWGEVNRRFGSKAGVVEPITKFNPLSALDPADPDFGDDVSAIAEALILQTAHDPHWPDSARELIGGLIAAEIQNSPGNASMRSVRKLVRAPIDILAAAVDLITEEFPDSLAAGKLAAIVEKGDDGESTGSREIASIRSTARTQTAFLDSESLLNSMATDDNPFDLTELATGKVTLYLVLPVDRLRTHGRWLRLILTLAIRAVSKVADMPKPPVVFLLDELGTISPGSGLAMVEQSYGLMAGLGIRIWAFLQDLPQLKRDYPASWETFISNSSVIQLLNVADNTTAKYFSEYLGNNTINAKTGSWSLKDRQHVLGTDMEQEWLDAATKHCLEKGYVHGTWDQAKAEVHRYGTAHISTNANSRIATAITTIRKEITDRGRSQLSQKEWKEDTQLMSRPVMFPWEIINADTTKSILIMPGQQSLQLKRFVYYSDPHLSKWARPNPNVAK